MFVAFLRTLPRQHSVNCLVILCSVRLVLLLNSKSVGGEGVVASCIIPLDKVRMRPLGHAFVHFQTRELASAAMVRRSVSFSLSVLASLATSSNIAKFAEDHERLYAAEWRETDA